MPRKRRVKRGSVYTREREERTEHALVILIPRTRHCTVYVNNERVLDWYFPKAFKYIQVTERVRRILKRHAVRYMHLFDLNLEKPRLREDPTKVPVVEHKEWWRRKALRDEKEKPKVIDQRKLLMGEGGFSYFVRKHAHCRDIRKQGQLLWDFTAPLRLDPDVYDHWLDDLSPPDNTNTDLGITSNAPDIHFTPFYTITYLKLKKKYPKGRLYERYPGEEDDDAVFHALGVNRLVKRNAGVTIDLGKYVNPPRHKLDRTFAETNRTLHTAKLLQGPDKEVVTAFGVPRSFKQTPWHHAGFDQDFVGARGGVRGRKMPPRVGNRVASHRTTRAERSLRYYNPKLGELDTIAVADYKQRQQAQQSRDLLKIEIQQAQTHMRDEYAKFRQEEARNRAPKSATPVRTNPRGKDQVQNS